MQGFKVWFESTLGVPFDQVSIVLALLSTYGLALVYTHTLKSQSPTVKHLFDICTSVAIYSTLFGITQIPALFTIPIMVFLLASYKHSQMYPISAIAISLSYMAINHFYYQFFAGPEETAEGTSTIMMIVIKASSFAWCLHDGTKDEKLLSSSQRKYAIKTMPSLLEYLGFMFFFGGVLVGPSLEFNDYMDFTHQRKPFDNIPSRTMPTLKCLGSAMVSMGILVALEPVFNFSFCLTDPFKEYGLLRKLLYIYAASFVARAKFYAAWKLSEGACNLVGIGYVGTDEKGNHIWTRAQNIKIRGFEFAQSPKDVTDSWNINTSKWLKNYVYLRITDPVSGKNQGLATFVTNLTSAIWHGLLSGYYLFFISCSVIIIVARTCRRCVRPLFVKSKLSYLKPLYDGLGIFFTALNIGYVMVPFCLRYYDPGMAVWKDIYFSVHILNLGLWLFLQYGGGRSLFRSLKIKYEVREKTNGEEDVGIVANQKNPKKEE